MFELKVANPELSGATCQVSWCVDAETLKHLSDMKITNPKVVIVVAPEGRHYHQSREYRKVVDMKDLMTYVELRCAGANKIWGFISFKGKDAKDYWTSKKQGEFRNSVLDSDGSEYSYYLRPEYDSDTKLTVSQPQPIVVPTGVFAEEPAEWEKAWVNHLFRDKPMDQCEFRRRRLFAYTFQIFPVMFFNMAIRLLVTLVALAIGTRGLSVKPLLHPLQESLGDTFDQLNNGSIFVRRVEEDSYSGWEPRPGEFFSYVLRKFCLLPLCPPALVIAFLMWHFHAIALTIVISVAMVLLMVVAFLITFFSSDSHIAFWKWLDKRLHGEMDGPLWYLDKDEMDLLTCKADQKPLDFASLPARKKTLYLRFQDLKSKVCKPFSA